MIGYICPECKLTTWTRLACEEGLFWSLKIGMTFKILICLIKYFFFFIPSLPPTQLCIYRMKMRRHRVFLLCTVGLCVISFLHYYKALHYVSLLRELTAPYPNIRSFIMVTGFFWKEKATPLSSVSPEEGPPPALRHSETRHQAQEETRGMGAPKPWARQEEPSHKDPDPGVNNY